MIIALDYDGTYTEDHLLWDSFVALAEQSGHTVYIVTMRYPQEEIRVSPVPMNQVWYTSRQAKRPFMEMHKIKVDVWIDDQPEFVLRSSEESLWPEHMRDAHPNNNLEKSEDG